MNSDVMTREGQVMGGERRAAQFCQPVVTTVPVAEINIPLRLKGKYVEAAMEDIEFKFVPDEDLLHLARTRKNIYCIDRLTAIVVLKGKL